MGERHLAGAHRVPSPHQPGGAHRVVRRAEGSRREDAALGAEEAGHRVDGGHLERLVDRHRRHDGGEAAGEHGLAPPRRAPEDEVVATGRGDLQRAPGPVLSAHVGQVHARRPEHGRVRGRLARAVERRPGLEVLGDLAEVVGDAHRDAGHRGRLARVVARHDGARDPWARYAPRSAGSTPRTGRRAPVSESSPSSAVPSRASAGILPSAPSVATAMATSKAPPLFLRSAGPRFTVITYSARLVPICWSAARTRTRLSRVLASARPTRRKFAGPRPESTSTRMGCASSPIRVKVSAVACMSGSLREGRAASIRATTPRFVGRRGLTPPVFGVAAASWVQHRSDGAMASGRARLPCSASRTDV